MEKEGSNMRTKKEEEMYEILEEICLMVDDEDNPELKDDEYIEVPFRLYGDMQKKLRNICGNVNHD